MAYALPPRIRSIAERSSVIASAGISSQWSTAAAIRSVMAMSSASGASTMMAATRASTSRRRPCWAVSDLLTHADAYSPIMRRCQHHVALSLIRG